MSKQCEICGKGKMNGKKIVSDAQGILGHSTYKREANLQKTTITDEKGNSRQIKVCTRCLKKMKKEA